MNKYQILSAALLMVFGGCGLLATQPQQQGGEGLLSTLDQIQQEFIQVPCKNKERLSAVRTLFERMGATPEEFSVDKYKDAENLVITLKGTEAGKVVIGAHYDSIESGCGAVDNWTGIVAMAHSYRSVRQLKIRKTILFVAFGNEEKGLWGSRAMARAIPKADISQYCAMINIDSFGLGQPFVLENVSSKKLTALVESEATSLGIPTYKVPINIADADSHPFLDRNIPAVTLSGLANNWQDVLHTKNDQTSKVIPTSVYLGYRLALVTWSAVDEAPCEAYSEKGRSPSK